MHQNPAMADDNIWTDEWDEGEDWSGGGGNAKRLPRGEELWLIHDVSKPADDG